MSVLRLSGYYTPRVHFSISEEQLARSGRLFKQRGLRSAALLKFHDWLMDKVELHGEIVAADIAHSDDFAAVVKHISKTSAIHPYKSSFLLPGGTKKNNHTLATGSLLLTLP